MILALDIGGTKIAAGLVDGPTVVEQAEAATPSQEGPEAIMDAAWELAHSLRPTTTPTTLAVASAGVIDPVAGVVTSATDALKDWRGTDLRAGMALRSGMEVHVLNDVHAHAWGEFRHGHGRGRGSMLLVAAGTGIGGGLVTGGRLVLGAGFVAGHFGHVDVAEAAGLACSCGRTGHVEAVASGTGIEQCFERATGRRLGGGEISRLAGTDDELADAARSVVTVAGHALGRTIGGLLNALDPGLVVLAGSVTRAGDTWREALGAGVRESAMAIVADTEIRMAELGNAALVGAAAWSSEKGWT